MPRPLRFENLTRPKPINLKLVGFGRFRVSSETRDPGVYRARQAMVRDLASRMQFDLLRARIDRRFTTAELHHAYRIGAAGLQQLLAEHKGKLVRPLLLQWFKEYRRKDRTRTRRRIEQFFEAHGGEKATTACLTPEAINAYLADRVNARYKDSRPTTSATLNRDRAAIGVFATWLVRRCVLDRHPIAYKAVPKAEEADPREPPPFMAEEYRDYFEKLYETRPDLAVVFRLLIHTGADIGEVLSRTVRDVDMNRGRVQYKRTKTRTPTRTVPIDDEVVQELRGHLAAYQLKPSDLLFGMFERNAIVRAHGWAREAISRPELRIKDLRHQAGMAWAAAGVDAVTIQRYMGHSTLNQTATYMRYAPGDQADQANATKAAERLRGPKGVIAMARKADSA